MAQGATIEQRGTAELLTELQSARSQIAALEQLLDVHERSSLEQATRLERTNRELDQFAYVASHDLKAPLRGIASLAHWIQEDLGEQLSPESQEHMRLLKGRVHRMEALIDGILTYSRAGRVREQVELVDVGALLHELIELLSPPADAEVTVGPGMPVLETERVPLQQVFMNLIGNAIKYGNREHLVITVGVAKRGDLFEFTVQDNGAGIAPQFHERIWQIFQTLAPRDEIEGAGIGLSVVRKLVETRGGLAWVESDVGRGSTFHFTWPGAMRTNI